VVVQIPPMAAVMQKAEGQQQLVVVAVCPTSKMSFIRSPA